MPKVEAQGIGVAGTEMKVYFSTITVINSNAMMEFLRSQSILSLSEWCDLEEAERWDVLSLMKRAGLVVGDRKKMLKSTLQVITDWRAEVAARGFLVRRNPLVWVATDGKDREKTCGFVEHWK